MTNKKPGKNKLLPESYREEAYNLFAAGITAPDIRKKCRDEWGFDVSIDTIYNAIKEYRTIRHQQFTTIIGADVNNIVSKYQWLQSELEIIFMENISDKHFAIKVADKLRSMYEFQLSAIKAHEMKNGDVSDAITDNGRDALIAELASKIPPKTELKAPDDAN